MARLMYGAGLRLLECCRLRVKDVDLSRGQLTVREGKGDKDQLCDVASGGPRRFGPTCSRSALAFPG
jgi:site-specific recombinase XerC